jgi:hypothetical protein
MFHYKIVWQASEELEDRESLAQIAASGEDSSLSDGETYIGQFKVLSLSSSNSCNLF